MDRFVKNTRRFISNMLYGGAYMFYQGAHKQIPMWEPDKRKINNWVEFLIPELPAPKMLADISEECKHISQFLRKLA